MLRTQWDQGHTKFWTSLNLLLRHLGDRSTAESIEVAFSLAKQVTTDQSRKKGQRYEGATVHLQFLRVPHTWPKRWRPKRRLNLVCLATRQGRSGLVSAKRPISILQDVGKELASAVALHSAFHIPHQRFSSNAMRLHWVAPGLSWLPIVLPIELEQSEDLMGVSATEFCAAP
jgi:hypothetical protein